MELNSDRAMVAIQGPKSGDILNENINGVKDLTLMNGNWCEFKDKKELGNRFG